jgi:hypothetical protein
VGGTYPVQAWNVSDKTASTRLVDSGSAGALASTLAGGVYYNYSDKALVFANGTAYAYAPTPAPLAALDGAFTVVTTVMPALGAADGTIWQFAGAAEGEEALTLGIEAQRYVLRYGSASRSTYFNDPAGGASAVLRRTTLLVRCTQGRLLCTLSSA